jgi:diketogulonate reductase-like aldo/keto reductase
MILEEYYKLSNGVAVPKIGLGTWFINDRDVISAVQDAVKLGYRHIDTAQAYQNERGVGQGIRLSGVKRKDLFVTSKLAAEIKSYRNAIEAIDNSLTTMGLDYLDMMLIHSPKPWAEFHDTNPHSEGNREAWRAFEDAYSAGKLRAIGLSNFQASDVDNIVEACSVKPMVNQILVHISNTPADLIGYCLRKNILIEAYSPVAHGELMKNIQVIRIAEKYGVTVPQLSIRYCLELGLLPLPKTANPQHMANNAEVDFSISESDMKILLTMEHIKNYGEASIFPVYGGRM